jgi:predicted nucleic acid-binding Zn finger protein
MSAGNIRRKTKMSQIKITTDDQNRTTIEIDGVVVPNVRNYVLMQEVDSCPVLTLDVVVTGKIIRVENAEVHRNVTVKAMLLDPAEEEAPWDETNTRP